MSLNEEKAYLPGALVTFKAVGIDGTNEDQYGVGSMFISAYRPENKFPWLDLGHIFYSSPTYKQFEKAKNSPEVSEGRESYSNIMRRLSKKQAELISRKICKMLKDEFPNGIPPDDEINIP